MRGAARRLEVAPRPSRAPPPAPAQCSSTPLHSALRTGASHARRSLQLALHVHGSRARSPPLGTASGAAGAGRLLRPHHDTRGLRCRVRVVDSRSAPRPSLQRCASSTVSARDGFRPRRCTSAPSLRPPRRRAPVEGLLRRLEVAPRSFRVPLRELDRLCSGPPQVRSVKVASSAARTTPEGSGGGCASSPRCRTPAVPCTAARARPSPLTPPSGATDAAPPPRRHHDMGGVRWRVCAVVSVPRPDPSAHLCASSSPALGTAPCAVGEGRFHRLGGRHVRAPVTGERCHSEVAARPSRAPPPTAASCSSSLHSGLGTGAFHARPPLHLGAPRAWSPSSLPSARPRLGCSSRSSPPSPRPRHERGVVGGAGPRLEGRNPALPRTVVVLGSVLERGLRVHVSRARPSLLATASRGAGGVGLRRHGHRTRGLGCGSSPSPRPRHGRPPVQGAARRLEGRTPPPRAAPPTRDHPRSDLRFLRCAGSCLRDPSGRARASPVAGGHQHQRSRAASTTLGLGHWHGHLARREAPCEARSADIRRSRPTAPGGGAISPEIGSGLPNEMFGGPL